MFYKGSQCISNCCPKLRVKFVYVGTGETVPESISLLTDDGCVCVCVCVVCVCVCVLCVCVCVCVCVRRREWGESVH